MSRRLDTVSRLVRTIRHLTPGQVAWRGVHVTRSRLERYPQLFPRHWRVSDTNAKAAMTQSLAVETCLPENGRPIADLWKRDRVCYHGIEGPALSWDAPKASRLWQYERQYHVEVLALAANCPPDEALTQIQRLTSSWAAECRPLSHPAWEPYPLARRIIHWAVAIARVPSLGQRLAPVLAPQVRFLASRLERHLLGNHLLCDLFALLCGTAVLNAAGMDDIRANAARMLEIQLNNQVLADGGYCERTFQYHAIVLRDMLWAIVLGDLSRKPLSIRNAAESMWRWMAVVGSCPKALLWINDAAPDTTPSLEGLCRLAEQAGIGPAQVQATTGPERITDLSQTGWILCRGDEGNFLLFDHGEVGPIHQPGHGHADALSYQLNWNGTPLVTDTGVSTYSAGAIRDAERGAAAHATVSVAGEGTDEVWSSFRVGGRAKNLVSERREQDGLFHLVASCTSFRGWTHDRRIAWWPGSALLMSDGVRGVAEGVSCISHIPLDRGWACRELSPGLFELSNEVGLALHLKILFGGDARIREAWKSEGFENRVPRTVIDVPLFRGAGAYAILAPDTNVSVRGQAIEIDRAGIRRSISLKAFVP